ncbi:MAG: hypothetical protein PHQ03_03905 [Methylococcales bacterium]|nr:hypothetical protein [Methylococcales bacterium]
MLNSVTNGASVTYFPPQKTSDNGSVDFRAAIKLLEEKANVYNSANIQPETDLRVDSIDLKSKFVVGVDGFEPLISSGTTITRTGGTKIPEPISVSELLQQTGMTKAEAEAILNPKPEPQSSVKSVMEMSPIEQKAFFQSQKVEAVVRDKEGNIVAKLYRNGMSMNLGYDGGTTPAEKVRRLENDPSVTVTYYSGDFSDYDLLQEKWDYAEKEFLKHPELYDSQVMTDIREFYKRILAA